MARTKKIADKTANTGASEPIVVFEEFIQNAKVKTQATLHKEKMNEIASQGNATKAQKSNLAFLQSATRKVIVKTPNNGKYDLSEVLAREYGNGGGMLNIIVKKEIDPVEIKISEDETVLKKHTYSDVISLPKNQFLAEVQNNFTEMKKDGKTILLPIANELEAFFIFKYLTAETFKKIYRAALPKLDSFDTDADYDNFVANQLARKQTIRISGMSFVASDILHVPFLPAEIASEEELKALCPQYLKELLNL